MGIEQKLAQVALAPVSGVDALAMMRLSILDWAACGIAGTAEPVAGIIRDRVLADAGREDAQVFGGGRVPARAAALANGTISHALDFDDTHFAHIGHPSVAVVPAALALAERQGAGFQDFVEAALIGVEGSIRTGVWLGRDHYEVGFHQTATAGAIGATLAAGRILQLTTDQMIAAIGIAATRASGLKSQFGTMGKPYNAGIAAETGVEAALLAQAGMTSTIAGLGGPQGLGPTHHGAAEIDAVSDFGQTWLFETISHKFHACCHGLHAMLEAVASTGLDAKDVASVTIQTHPRWMTVCNKPDPVTGLEAKFSYRQTCAMALHGVETAAIDSFTDATAGRADLAATRQLIKVEPTTRLSEMQARVIFTLKSGETRESFHDLDARMPIDTRQAKILRKAKGLIGNRHGPLWTAIQRNDINGFVDGLA